MIRKLFGLSWSAILHFYLVVTPDGIHFRT